MFANGDKLEGEWVFGNKQGFFVFTHFVGGQTEI
jgi:hypothetical protein